MAAFRSLSMSSSLSKRLSPEQNAALERNRIETDFINQIGSWSKAPIPFESITLRNSTKLKNYQSEASARIIKQWKEESTKYINNQIPNNTGIILKADPGLGKTVMTLDALVKMIQQFPQLSTSLDGTANGRGIRGILLVMPANLITQWCKEIARFTHISPKMTYILTSTKDNINIHQIGRKAPSPREVVEDLWESEDIDNNNINNPKQPEPYIVLTSYTIIQRLEKNNKCPLANFLLNDLFDVIVADECQCYNNPKSKRFQFLQRIVKANPSAFKICLSGSLIMNEFRKDLAAQSRILSRSDPEDWSNPVWWAMFSIEKEKVKQWEVANLIQILTKDAWSGEDATDMPKLIDHPVERLEVGKSVAAAVQLAEDIIEQGIKGVTNAIKLESNMLKRITLLIQTNLHPACIEDEEVLDQYREAEIPVITAQDHSHKTLWIMNTIDAVLKKNPNTRIIVFSRFLKFLKIMKGFVQRDRRLRCGEYNGSMAIPAKDHAASSFRSGEINILLATITAGGIGLNLPTPNNDPAAVIFAEPQWNAIEDQAIRRIYRFGQKGDVEVFRGISKDTVEEWVHRVCERKKQDAEGVFESGIIKTPSQKVYLKELRVWFKLSVKEADEDKQDKLHRKIQELEKTKIDPDYCDILEQEDTSTISRRSRPRKSQRLEIMKKLETTLTKSTKFTPMDTDCDDEMEEQPVSRETKPTVPKLPVGSSNASTNQSQQRERKSSIQIVPINSDVSPTPGPSKRKSRVIEDDDDNFVDIRSIRPKTTPTPTVSNNNSTVPNNTCRNIDKESEEYQKWYKYYHDIFSAALDVKQCQ